MSEPNEACPECGAAFEKVLQERNGPTLYWKCLSYQRSGMSHQASVMCDMRSLENELAAATAQAETAKREVKWLREVLSNIASPLNYLQELKRLKGDEFDMEWPIAIQLSESAEFLKQIARDALLAQPREEASIGPQRARPLSQAQLRDVANQAREAVERAIIEAKETCEAINAQVAAARKD